MRNFLGLQHADTLEDSAGEQRSNDSRHNEEPLQGPGRDFQIKRRHERSKREPAEEDGAVLKGGSEDELDTWAKWTKRIIARHECHDNGCSHVEKVSHEEHSHDRRERFSCDLSTVSRECYEQDNVR